MPPRVPSQFCTHLKTKLMYTQPAVQETDFTSYCWCVKTMAALGPDQIPVEPARCTSGRSCFESQNEE